MLNSRDRALITIYLAIGVLALIGTWTANVTFLVQHETLNPVEWFRTAVTENPVSVSLSIDIAGMFLAAAVFMWIESRRLGIRWFWAYVVLSVLVAVSVFFPVFMAVRQRRIAERRPACSPS